MVRSMVLRRARRYYHNDHALYSSEKTKLMLDEIFQRSAVFLVYEKMCSLFLFFRHRPGHSLRGKIKWHAMKNTRLKMWQNLKRVSLGHFKNHKHLFSEECILMYLHRYLDISTTYNCNICILISSIRHNCVIDTQFHCVPCSQPLNI